MRFSRMMMHRFRSLFRRSHADTSLQREIELHFEQLVKESINAGMSEAEARLMASRQFGAIEKTKEECRDERRVNLIDNFLRDTRYALRGLANNPGFATTAIITLTMGIAANTTIFSAVSAILLRKPPVSDPDRLCAVSSKNLVKGDDLIGVSAPDFKSWQTQHGAFEGMAAAELGRSFTLTGGNEPEAVRGDRVTPNYFQLIGVMPVLGRTFFSNEGQSGSEHVVILSDTLWRQRFGSDPNAVGKSLRINGELHTIVGVMPPRNNVILFSAQLWTPLVFGPEDLSSSARGNHYLDLVLGRLKRGITIHQAQAEMAAVAQRLAKTYPATNQDWGVTVLTLQEYSIRSRNIRNGMMLIMTVVGLMLLITCANIAGLLLARDGARAREMAVKSAIGASRGRLLRQMLTESMLVSLVGGGFGLLLSIWGIALLRVGFAFNNYGRQLAGGFRLDKSTLLFTLIVTLFTSIVFGLVPAIRASKADMRDALSESGRALSGSASRLRSVLVTGEVALALVLLAAAGVDLREVVRELNAPNGFNPYHLFVADLDVSSREYKELNSRIKLFEQTIGKLRNLPDVESVDIDSCVPMGCSYSTYSISLGIRQ